MTTICRADILAVLADGGVLFSMSFDNRSAEIPAKLLKITILLHFNLELYTIQLISSKYM